MLTDSGLVDPAVERWTLEYLREHAAAAFRFAVYTSSTHFQYSDLSNNSGGFAFSSRVNKEKVRTHHSHSVCGAIYEYVHCEI